MNAPLVLRDIHVSPAPPWWPPAPGWWLVGIGLLLVLGVLAWRWQRRRRHRARAARWFDEALAAADSPPQAVAAMSELLRRAARRHDPQADRLQGDAWLALLDRGATPPLFGAAHGRLLLEGGFRREVDAGDVEVLRRIARKRFIDWMAAR